MKIKKTIAFIMIEIITCITLSGCWDYKELNEVKYVTGIAIDINEADQYVVTMEILEPNEQQNGFVGALVEGRGKTIHEALRDSIQVTGQKARVSHTSSFIIGREIAAKGIIPVIDLIDRDVEVRADMMLFISEGGRASEIYTKTRELGEIVSYKLEDSMAARKSSGKYSTTRLYEFLNSYESDGIEPIASNIKIENRGYDVISFLNGIDVFKDDKVIGHLKPEQALFYSLIMEKKMSPAIPISSKSGTAISLEVLDTKSKMKPGKKDDQLIMDINLEIDAVISEICGNDKNYIDKEGRKEVVQVGEDHIELQISNLVNKLQKEYNSDILGFGKKFSTDMPKEWKKVKDNWDEEFPKVKTNVNVDITIKGSGLFNNIIEKSD